MPARLSHINAIHNLINQQHASRITDIANRIHGSGDNMLIAAKGYKSPEEPGEFMIPENVVKKKGVGYFNKMIGGAPKTRPVSTATGIPHYVDGGSIQIPFSQPDFNDPAYKQWLINKIQSGQTDYTYGPSSPGATPSDMHQFIGAHDNPLQTGNIALPPKDYALFSPQERDQYGIADTSFIKPGQPTPTGSVERYYGNDANYQNTPQYTQVPQSNSMSTPQPDGSNTGQMGTWANYYNPQPSTTQNVASGIGSALQGLGKGMQQSGSSNQATSMLSKPDPAAAALSQEANNPLGSLLALYQLTGGRM